MPEWSRQIERRGGRAPRRYGLQDGYLVISQNLTAHGNAHDLGTHGPLSTCDTGHVCGLGGEVGSLEGHSVEIAGRVEGSGPA